MTDQLETKDDPVTFSTQRHCRDIVSLLAYIRTNSKLFDIWLVVGDCTIPTHKIVLCACSNYFRKMFLCGMRECHSDQIPITCVSAPILKLIVDYAYTGEVSISRETIEPLLDAAVILQVPSVIISCCTFLASRITPSNCLAVSRLARLYFCPECQLLAKKAMDFLFTNFPEVSVSHDFLELPFDELNEILSSDHLVTRCEAQKFSALVSWIDHHFEDRFDHLETLMGLVNLADVPLTFLRRQVLNPQRTTQSPKCRGLLTRLIWKAENTDSLVPQRLHPEPVVYVIGGYNVKSMSHFECFCPFTNHWYRLPDLPDVRNGLCCAVTHQYLYVIGGKNGNFFHGNFYNSVFRYDPLSNCWDDCSSMQTARSRAGIGVIDHHIYVTGGFRGMEHLESVEKYCPSINKWTFVAPMSFPRMGHGSAVLQRQLYVVGGFHDNQRTNSVSRYCPDSDRWTEVAPLNHSRSGAGCCHTCSHIYVIGGFDGENVLGSVERYDPAKNEWSLLSPLPHPVSGLACTVVMPDMIIVFGGFNGTEFVSRFQIYDIGAEKWRDEPTDNFGRTGHGITVGNKPQIIHQMKDQNIYYLCNSIQ